jgi:thioredoxin reductase-like selenoprotein T
MRRNYVNLAQFLQKQFPEVTVDGGSYPPPPVVEMLGNVLWVLQGIGVLWIVLGGDRILSMVGLARPDAHNRLVMPTWYYQVQEYRIQIGILLFLLLPQFLAKFMVTGAFEVYVDGRQIWSRIAEGRFPTESEILHALAAAGLRRT